MEQKPDTGALPAALPEKEQTLPEKAAPQKPPRAEKPKKPARQRRLLPIIGTALALVMVIIFAVFSFSLLSLAGTVRSLFTPATPNTNAPDGTFSVISVIGTIQTASGGALGVGEPSYKHSDTVAYIKKMTGDAGNKGILLYMNTGGGGVYESDEVYRALLAYTEETGRPVWAYMGAACASGGYYICMAAEHLIANYNTTTGSIGVYIALTDLSGLYEELGVETVLIRSGENKGIGVEGTAISEENRAVYQSIVDESYERFLDLVALGRDMPLSTARALSDGRPYTANQALQNGLVDELGDWDSALAAFSQLTDASPFYPSFSRQAPVADLIAGFENALPQSSDAAALLDRVEDLPSGVPMAYAPGLSW